MSSRHGFAALLFLMISAAVGWRFLAESDAGGQMTTAAKSFLNTLNDEERSAGAMAFDNSARVDWHFIPKEQRKGLKVGDMDAETRQAAMELLNAGLSEIGYTKARTIMELESILHELEKDRGGRFVRDPHRYYFTVFGEPDENGTWGLSVEGHHLSLNFVVRGNTVSAHTPAFFGANPAIVMSDVDAGPKKGHRTLEKEETLAFELVNSLSDEQRRTAILSDEAPDEIRAAGKAQPVREPTRGISVEELTPDQRSIVRQLVETYARNMPGNVAEKELRAIREAGAENIHFAWAGATKPGIGHYYAVEGPTFVLEFVNVQPDSAGNPANHIHSVWRSAEGDFGLHGH